MSNKKEAILLGLLVSIATALTAHRQEWVAASIGGFLSIGAWVQVGILAAKQPYRNCVNRDQRRSWAFRFAEKHCGFSSIMSSPPEMNIEHRFERLKSVAAEAYQACGAGGAPSRLLDNLSAAASDKPIPHETILPVAPDEWRTA